LGRDGYLAEARLEAMFAVHFQLEAWRPTLAVSTPWGPFPQILPTQPLGCFVSLFRAPSNTPEWRTAQAELSQATEALRNADLADLQQQADLHERQAAYVEQCIAQAVSHYRRDPTRENYDAISRSVRSLKNILNGYRPLG
jgi:hypothetical protein